MNLLQLQAVLAHESWVYSKGWIVTIVGFCIVVFALYILSLLFCGVAAYFTKKDAGNSTKEILSLLYDAVAARFARKDAGDTAKPEQKETPEPTADPAAEDGIPAGVLTAIGMALYLSANLHDVESNVITIDRKPTSWNAKSYGVRHWNR